jgi:hypothetical protein
MAGTNLQSTCKTILALAFTLPMIALAKAGFARQSQSAPFGG